MGIMFTQKENSEIIYLRSSDINSYIVRLQGRWGSEKAGWCSVSKETISRIGIDGDNWCITWVEDGSQVTSLCDGIWLKLDYPEEGYFHNHLFRITGEAGQGRSGASNCWNRPITASRGTG